MSVLFKNERRLADAEDLEILDMEVPGMSYQTNQDEHSNRSGRPFMSPERVLILLVVYAREPALSQVEGVGILTFVGPNS